MKQLVFDGRLGKDAEIITTNNGQQYLRFSVANNSYSKANGEKTEWIDVVCFDPFLVKSKQEVLKKGYYVIVSGNLDVTLATLQDGRTFINQKVNATTIEIPNFGKNNDSQTSQAHVQTQNQMQPQPQMQQPNMISHMPQAPVQQQMQQPQYQAQAQTTQQMVQPQVQPMYQANIQQPVMPQQPQYQQAPVGGTTTIDSDLPF